MECPGLRILVLVAAVKAGVCWQGSDWRSMQDEPPDYLAEFEAIEVVGCDVNSLQLYLGYDSAFGVHPHQLKSEGWVPRNSTAMVLYEIEETKLYGIWKITGRQVASGKQVVTVEPVKKFAALEEGLWGELLTYTEGPGEDGYVGYQYPQLLDKANTQALICLFWYAENSSNQIDMVASRDNEGQLQSNNSSLLRSLDQ